MFFFYLDWFILFYIRELSSPTIGCYVFMFLYMYFWNILDYIMNP